MPAGVWMGARPVRDDAEAYSFFGCTLAPGFDHDDYAPGWRDELLAAYPTRAALIAALTRPEFAAQPTGPARSPLDDTPPAPRSRVLAPGEAIATEIAPGVTLREIAGRAAPIRTEAVSVTPFRLAAGASTGSSRYLGAEEFFLVLSGSGVATIGDATFPVGPGSLVVVARGEPHALSADATGPLEFVAIIAPAFNPALHMPEPPSA